MARRIISLLLAGTQKPALVCPRRLNEVWKELEVRAEAVVPSALLIGGGRKSTDSLLLLLCSMLRVSKTMD